VLDIYPALTRINLHGNGERVNLVHDEDPWPGAVTRPIRNHNHQQVMATPDLI
jgi:hypothetical protein